MAYPATLASVAGLFKSCPTPGGRRVGRDKIGLCAKVLFMACSALFMVLFSVLLLLEDGRARAHWFGAEAEHDLMRVTEGGGDNVITPGAAHGFSSGPPSVAIVADGRGSGGRVRDEAVRGAGAGRGFLICPGHSRPGEDRPKARQWPLAVTEGRETR
jgi:hypothetical protein